MEIYIGKDGQVLGPYFPDEIQKRLDADLFDGTEKAWHDGLEAWVNVKELLEDDAHSQEAEDEPTPETEEPSVETESAEESEPSDEETLEQVNKIKELISDGHADTAWTLVRSLNNPRIYEGLLEDCPVNDDGWVNAPEYLSESGDLFIKLLLNLSESAKLQPELNPPTKLILLNNQITTQQIDELQQVLPECDIISKILKEREYIMVPDNLAALILALVAVVVYFIFAPMAEKQVEEMGDYAEMIAQYGRENRVIRDTSASQLRMHRGMGQFADGYELMGRMEQAESNLNAEIARNSAGFELVLRETLLGRIWGAMPYLNTAEEEILEETEDERNVPRTDTERFRSEVIRLSHMRNINSTSESPLLLQLDAKRGLNDQHIRRSISLIDRYSGDKLFTRQEKLLVLFFILATIAALLATRRFDARNSQV